MPEQGLSRADVLASKPAELQVLDDRSKGQKFVYDLNTDGGEELVAGRIKLPPYILKVTMLPMPKVKTRGNMRVINLCSWTGVADGIKDPHYPADVVSVKVKEHAEKVANGLAVFGKENIKPELLPHFEGLRPLVAYLTGVVESLVHWEAFEMVANITKRSPSNCENETNRKLQQHVIPFTSSFLACSNRQQKFNIQDQLQYCGG
ncbi:hypothetical protein BDR26DRAFT_923911 [Obelidium mucronatum]|nr:hypothetical protein BDR26DRAFT_923911 [Obelidium mucronatum]